MRVSTQHLNTGINIGWDLNRQMFLLAPTVGKERVFIDGRIVISRQTIVFDDNPIPVNKWLKKAEYKEFLTLLLATQECPNF